MSKTLRELPKYKSHKIVHALKIKEVNGLADGGAMIVPVISRYAPFKVDLKYVSKHQPKTGGYYVVYEDGYKSWSPAKVFEEGYTLLEDLDMAGLDHDNWTKDCQGVFLKVNDSNIVQCNECGMTINESLAQIRVDTKKRIK